MAKSSRKCLSVLQKKKSIEKLKTKQNAFDFKVNKVKQVVLGRKSKNSVGKPVISHKRGYNKRKKTLKKELYNLLKKNQFTDSRNEVEEIIEEKNPLVNEYLKSSKSKLTHKGVEIDKVDTKDECGIKLTKLPNSDETGNHFGGFLDDIKLPTINQNSTTSKSKIPSYMQDYFSKITEEKKNDEMIVELFEKLENTWSDVKHDLEAMNNDLVENVPIVNVDDKGSTSDYDIILQSLSNASKIKITKPLSTAEITAESKNKSCYIIPEKHELSVDRLESKSNKLTGGKSLGQMPKELDAISKFLNFSNVDATKNYASLEMHKLMDSDPFAHIGSDLNNFSRELINQGTLTLLDKLILPSKPIPNIVLKSLMIKLIDFLLTPLCDYSAETHERLFLTFKMLSKKYLPEAIDYLLIKIVSMDSLHSCIAFFSIVKVLLPHCVDEKKGAESSRLLSISITKACGFLRSIKDLQNLLVLCELIHDCFQFCRRIAIPDIFQFFYQNMDFISSMNVPIDIDIVRVELQFKMMSIYLKFGTGLEKYPDLFSIYRMKLVNIKDYLQKFDAFKSEKLDLYRQNINEMIPTLLNSPTMSQNKTLLNQGLSFRRPKLLQMLEPVIPETSSSGKRSRSEKSVLKHRMKREYRGAVREIRKDTQFLAREKLKMIFTNDEFKQQKMKAFEKSLAEERNMVLSGDED